MSATPPSPRLSLELPCTHEAVRVGRRTAQTFARTEGLVDEEIERLMLVVSELLANAVDHGGGGGAFTEDDLEGDVRMQLRLELDGKGWLLEVEDQGGQQVASADLLGGIDLSDPEDERGRGMFLVREMVTSLGVRQGAAGLVIEARRKLDRG